MCRKIDFFLNLRRIGLAALETLEDVLSEQEQEVVRELNLWRTHPAPGAWHVPRAENDNEAGAE